MAAEAPGRTAPTTSTLTCGTESAKPLMAPCASWALRRGGAPCAAIAYWAALLLSVGEGGGGDGGRLGGGGGRGEGGDGGGLGCGGGGGGGGQVAEAAEAAATVEGLAAAKTEGAAEAAATAAGCQREVPPCDMDNAQGAPLFDAQSQALFETEPRDVSGNDNMREFLQYDGLDRCCGCCSGCGGGGCDVTAVAQAARAVAAKVELKVVARVVVARVVVAWVVSPCALCARLWRQGVGIQH